MDGPRASMWPEKERRGGPKDRRRADADHIPDSEERREAALDRRKAAAEEMIAFFQAATLFQDLGAAEVQGLLPFFRRRRVRGGEYVFWEGELGESLFFILRGEVRLTKQLDGEEEFLATLERGASFGETGLLRGGIRSASAMAQADCQFLILDKSQFDRFQGDIALKLLRNVAFAGVEKLVMADQLIERLYRQLRAMKAKEEKAKS